MQLLVYSKTHCHEYDWLDLRLKSDTVGLYSSKLYAQKAAPGAYLISDTPERGLNRDEGLFTKSSHKDVFGGFSVLLSHILGNQHKILRLKYINLAQSRTISKSTCKVV